MTRREFAATSGIWFFGLGSFGIRLPFFALYLEENAELRGSEVGLVLAVVQLTSLIAQPFWGQVADRTGSRTWVVTALALGTGVGSLAIGFADGLTTLLLTTGAAAFFWSSLVPSATAVTLAVAGAGDAHAFGRIRVFGTIGFGCFALGFPWLLDVYERWRDLAPAIATGPSEPALGLMFPVSAAIAFLCAVCALTLPRVGAVALRANAGDWRELLRSRPYLRLLAYVLVANVFLHGPLSMYPNLIRSRGGDLTVVSQMWIFMLLLEVPLVAMTGSTLARIGARGLLGIAIVAGGVRWLVCALAEDLSWLYAASLLHGVVVAGLIIGGPLYAEAVVPARLRSTAQGVLGMIGTGVGALISAFATGWLFEHAGPRAPYLYGGVAALALALLLPSWIPAPRASDAQPRESS